MFRVGNAYSVRTLDRAIYLHDFGESYLPRDLPKVRWASHGGPDRRYRAAREVALYLSDQVKRCERAYCEGDNYRDFELFNAWRLRRDMQAIFKGN